MNSSLLKTTIACLLVAPAGCAGLKTTNNQDVSVASSSSFSQSQNMERDSALASSPYSNTTTRHGYVPRHLRNQQPDNSTTSPTDDRPFADWQDTQLATNQPANNSPVTRSDVQTASWQHDSSTTTDGSSRRGFEPQSTAPLGSPAIQDNDVARAIAVSQATTAQQAPPNVRQTSTIVMPAEVGFDEPPLINQNDSQLVSTPVIHPAGSNATTSAIALPSTTNDPTLADLEQQAIAHHPALAEARARVSAAAGDWRQAGLGPNPHVGFSGQQLGAGGAAEQIGVFVGQKIIRGDKLELDQAVISRDVRRLEQELHRTQLAVLAEIRRAYFALAIAQEKVRVSQEMLQTAEESLRLTQLLKDNREASQIDVLRTDIQRQLIETTLRNAEVELVAAEARIEAALGPNSNVDTESLQANIPDQNQWAFQLDPELLLQQHPDLAMLSFEIERARWRIQRECAERVPDIDVQAVWQYDESVDGSNAVLQITGPLMIRNRNQGAIQSAYAQLTAANHKFERQELALSRQIIEATAAFEQSREQALRFAQPGGILEKSRQTVELLKTGVAAGEINRLELVLAQRERTQSELDYLDSLAIVLDQKARLESSLIDSVSTQ